MTRAKFDIEKFDDTGDFGLWRVKMGALLIQHGCEAALEVLPADMEAQVKVELNRKAHSAVILCLSNKVLREVTGAMTAARVWSTLETLYMIKSLGLQFASQKQDTLWVKWIHAVKLKGNSIWNVQENCWKWPNEWMTKYPDIVNIPVPNLKTTTDDKVIWKNKSGNIVKFSVKNVLDDLLWKESQKLMNTNNLPDSWEDVIQKMSKMKNNNSIWNIVRRISLGSTVYFIWNERNPRLFKGEERGGLCLKSHVEDDTASSNPNWCQLDNLIKMWIPSSFCDFLQEQVVTTPGNAKALWDHLKDLFHDNKDNRVINLDNELRSIKIGTMTVNEYCTKIRSMEDRLKNFGCDVSDKNLVMYTVNRLDSRFATLVDIIRHHETLPSFETTRTMLLLNESSFKDGTRTFSTFDGNSFSSTALVTSTSSTPKGSSSKSPTLPQLSNLFNKGTCRFGDRCKYIHDHRNRVRLSFTRNQSRSTASSHAGVWDTAGIQHRAFAPHVSSYRPSYNFIAGPTAFYTGPVHYSSQPHPL
nr:hybrid signal transduction histidine kinase M [Tanacetum cinerariifolium]